VVAHVALVSETPRLALSEAVQVSAAIQKQVTEDFGPAWEIEATVDAFDQLVHVPLGYYPVVVRDDIGIDDLGAHHDQLGRPFALVQYHDDWPLTASHEVLEMLADPFSTLFFPGPSLHPDQGPVVYLAEICDPCQAASFGYDVNSFLLSDFITPHFYDAFAAPSVRYSFRGNVTAPRQVLSGGYVTWREPVSGDWWQLQVTGSKSQLVELGLDPTFAAISLRGAIDRATGLRPLALTAAARQTAEGAQPARRRPGGAVGPLAAADRPAVRADMSNRRFRSTPFWGRCRPGWSSRPRTR
jgi:hypothetical protein